MGGEVFGCIDGAVPSDPALGGPAQRPGAQFEAGDKTVMP